VECSVGRYYDPETGQFLSVDPKIEQTLEAFIYVGDDPVNAIDPNGLGCGWNPFCYIGSAYNAINGAVNAALAWAEGYTQNLECQQWGLAQSRLAAILGCPIELGRQVWPGAAGITIPSGQFGEKIRYHARDWGLNPKSPADRVEMERIIREIADHPDEIRIGPWWPENGGGYRRPRE
jgi:hypothetical protein